MKGNRRESALSVGDAAMALAAKARAFVSAETDNAWLELSRAAEDYAKARRVGRNNRDSWKRRKRLQER